MSRSKDLDEACALAERKFLLTTSKGLSQSWDGAYINELDLFTGQFGPHDRLLISSTRPLAVQLTHR